MNTYYDPHGSITQFYDSWLIYKPWYGTNFLIGSQFFIAHLQTLLETTNLPPVLTVNHVFPPDTPPLLLLDFNNGAFFTKIHQPGPGTNALQFRSQSLYKLFFIVRWYRDQFSASKKLDGSVVEKKEGETQKAATNKTKNLLWNVCSLRSNDVLSL